MEEEGSERNGGGRGKKGRRELVKEREIEGRDKRREGRSKTHRQCTDNSILALDLNVAGIENRFDQSGYRMFKNLENCIFLFVPNLVRDV